MSGGLLSHALALFARYGFPILLPIAVFEGPAVAAIAGALIAAGQLDAAGATLLLVAADLVGDTVYYTLGRFSGAPLSRQINRWLALTPERTAPLQQRFHDHDWKLLLVGKTQAFGSLILYFAGVSRMNFLRFMAINILATAPKVILFEAVGFFLGHSILHSLRYVDYVTAGFFAIALLLLAGYFLARRFIAKAEAEDR